MRQTFMVVYDGEVLRPQESLPLEVDKEYAITIRETNGEDQTPASPDGILDIFAFVLENAQDLGIEDLAEQHDHYLYGTPKR